MKYKRAVYIILSFCLCLALCSCSVGYSADAAKYYPEGFKAINLNSPSDAIEMTDYEFEFISFSYPTGWNVKDTTEGVKDDDEAYPSLDISSPDGNIIFEINYYVLPGANSESEDSELEAIYNDKQSLIKESGNKLDNASVEQVLLSREKCIRFYCEGKDNNKFVCYDTFIDYIDSKNDIQITFTYPQSNKTDAAKYIDAILYSININEKLVKDE